MINLNYMKIFLILMKNKFMMLISFYREKIVKIIYIIRKKRLIIINKKNQK